MDRFIQFAVAAADFALKDSGLDDRRPRTPRWSGVYIGSGIGGFATIEREHSDAPEAAGPRKVSPFFIPAAIVNLASGWVSIRTGAKGPELRHLHRLHHQRARGGRLLPAHPARRRRRHDRGRQRGGHHAAGRRRVLRPCARSPRATTSRQRASRPFDRDRDGFVIGEGAGIVILEELEHARAAAARRSTARWSGYGMSGDAYHISAPCEDGDGAIRVMQQDAQGRAASSPTAVDYVNVHGTSTPAGRQGRGRWPSRRVFGDHARKLAISSTKSMTGHLLGAAGGLEAGHHRPGPPRPGAAADHQPREPRPRVRPRLRAQRRPARPSVALRALELVRLRRHQRRAALQALRGLNWTPADGRQDTRGADATMKIVVCVKQVPGHRDADPHRARRQGDRRERRQLDRLALRRVRDRGGAAHQGEAKGGEVVLVSARPRPRAVRAAQRPGHGRRLRVHLKDPLFDEPRHAGHGAGAGRGDQAARRPTSSSPASRAWAATTARCRGCWRRSWTCPRSRWR